MDLMILDYVLVLEKNTCFNTLPYAYKTEKPEYLKNLELPKRILNEYAINKF
jgi:hypothetical protein